jgi:hypothetical protein
MVGLGALVLSGCGSVTDSSQRAAPSASAGAGGNFDGGAETGGTGAGGAGGRGAGGIIAAGGQGAGGIIAAGGQAAGGSVAAGGTAAGGVPGAVDGGLVPIDTTGCFAACSSDNDCAACPGAATCTSGQCTLVCSPGTVVSHDVKLGAAHPGDVHEVLGATEIQGNVTVEGDGMYDLKILACLEHVTGDVVIGIQQVCSPSFGCFPTPVSELTSLTGLEKLARIDGNLSATANKQLATIDALSSLTGTLKGLSIAAPLVKSLSVFRGITSVTNDLVVSTCDLTSLDGLQSITSVGGSLTIGSLDKITSMAGLEGLTSVGGVLSVALSDAIESFKGLDHLAVVSGTLRVTTNRALKDFTGLGALREIGGSLEVEANRAIESFAGLDALRRIGGRLQIQDETALTSLAPLSGVTSLGESVSLTMVPALTNVDGFPSVTSLNGDLYINDAATLRDLKGFSKLTNATGLVLTLVPELTSLTGLEGITSLPRIGIEDAPKLASVGGLSGVRGTSELLFRQVGVANFAGLEGITGGYFIVNDNPALTSLAGLAGFTDPTTVDVRFNKKLTNIAALSSMKSVQGDLVIMQNDALTSLNGLQNLTTVTGYIDIGENPLVTTLAPLAGVHGKLAGLFVSGSGLVDLHGLEGITGTQYGLGIGTSNWNENQVGTAGLTSVRGLEGITSVGMLTIRNNEDLVNLSGLANLKTVEYDVVIRGNAALTKLAGLYGITSIGGQLAIFENPLLPNCEAVAFATHLNTTCGPNEVVCQDVCTCPGNNGTGTCP